MHFTRCLKLFSLFGFILPVSNLTQTVLAQQYQLSDPALLQKKGVKSITWIYDYGADLDTANTYHFNPPGYLTHYHYLCIFHTDSVGVSTVSMCGLNTFLYNSSNQLEWQINQNQYSSMQPIDTLWAKKYEYNHEGQILNKYSYEGYSAERKHLSQITHYEYSDGLLSYSVIVDIRGAISVKRDSSIFIYDDDNRQVKSCTYRNGEFIDSTTSSYDSKNNIHHFIQYDLKGEIVLRGYWRYDKHDRLLELNYKDHDGSKQQLWEYSKDGLPKSMTNIYASGTKNTLTFVYTYY